MNLIRTALLVTLIIQALRSTPMIAPAPPSSTPTPLPVETEDKASANTECSADLPEDGSADFQAVKQALACWKSQGAPGGSFCPAGYGHIFNTSECWRRVYQFEAPPPTAYPSPYP